MNIPGYDLQAIRIYGASDAIWCGGFGNSGKTRQQTREKKAEDIQKARGFRMVGGHKGEEVLNGSAYILAAVPSRTSHGGVLLLLL